MIFFNDNALIVSMIGLACGFGVYSFSRNSSAAGIVGALSIIVFDLIFRLRNQDQETPLLAPAAGGHIWFIPLWVLGIIGTGIGGTIWLGWL